MNHVKRIEEKSKEESRRGRVCFCVSTLVSFTLFIFGPIELFFANQSDLWFEFSDIIFYIILAAVLCFAVIFCLCFFLRGRASRFVINIFFGVGLACYLQGNFINIDYGELNGTEIVWTDYNLYAIIDIAVWLACLALPFIFDRFLKKYADKIFIGSSLMIVAMQLVALIVVSITSSSSSANKNYILSNDGMLDVSENHNIVIFCLDTMDAQYFEAVLNSNDEIKQKLDGFTYFNDMTAGGAPTVFGLPSLLTGEYFTYDYSAPGEYQRYLDDSYEKCPLYKELYNKGYDIAWYIPNFSPSIISDVVSPYLSNYSEEKTTVTSKLGLTAKMYQFVGFKYSPHIAKKYFWFYTGDFDAYKDTSVTGQYVMDDIGLYKYFTTNEMKTIESRNIFRFFHLNGSHAPVKMNENCKPADKNSSDIIRQTEGALNIVFRYMDMLKESGVYENTNIIITADHGGLYLGQNPAFAVKPAGSTGELKTNSAQVSFCEVPATIMSFFLDDYSQFGRSVFDIPEDEERIRYLYIHGDAHFFQDLGITSTTSVVKYRINGISRNLENIIEIENVIEYPRKINEYTLGEEIGFMTGRYSAFYAPYYLYSGFSHQEEKYTWSSGKEGLMKLHMDSDNYNDLYLQISYAGVYAGSAEMIISTEKRVIYDNIISGSGDIFISLSPDDFVDGNLTLFFEWPDAVSPYELNGSGDARVLSIAFESMWIRRGAVPENGIDYKNAYALGDEITFAAGGNARNYLSYGFAGPEKEYTWSSGKNSKMLMTVKRLGEYDEFDLNIHYSGVFHNPQKMIISSANRILCEEELLSSKEGDIAVSINKDDFINGTLVLNFEYPNAISPYERGLSGDKRILCVAFESMKLIPVE